MIEVEKKFLLSAADEKNLIAGAEPVGERTFTDIYFDGPGNSLTLNNKWLRARDGKFQLKMPMDNKGANKNSMMRYEEFEAETDIKKALGLEAEGPLAEALQKNGYQPCAEFTTKRKRYRKEGFTLDFDIADFGYKIAEIELLVEKRSDMDAAGEKINEFARRHGLDLAPVRAKIHEYLRERNPAHFKALVRAGIAPKPD